MLSIKQEPKETCEEESVGRIIPEVYASITVDPGIGATSEAGSTLSQEGVRNEVEEEEKSDPSQRTGIDISSVPQIIKGYSTHPTVYDLLSRVRLPSSIANDGFYSYAHGSQRLVHSTSERPRNSFCQVSSGSEKCYDKQDGGIGKGEQRKVSVNFDPKLAAQEIVHAQSSKNRSHLHNVIPVEVSTTSSSKQEGKVTGIPLSEELPVRDQLKKESLTSKTECGGSESPTFEPKPFKFPLCQKLFIKKFDCQYGTSNTDEEPLEWEFREQRFNKVDGSSNHEITLTVKKPFRGRGQFRKKAISSKEASEPHNCLQSGTKSHKCQYCEKSFTLEGKLKTHEMVHHSEYRFRCKCCDKAFKTKYFCKKHELSNGLATPFNCQYCMKSFLRKRDCVKHEYVHTGNQPFKCKYCEKSFTMKADCERHECIHTGENPFKCRYCEKSFKWKRDCKNHERMHKGIRPFKCQYCEKCFTRRADCRRHERIHTGERPYKCRHCGKAYIQKGQCQKHEMKHTGEKPFKCQFCEKSYYSKQDCKGHEMIHTHGKPFSCQFCEKSFIRKRDCHRHERNVHKAKNTL